MSESLSAQHSNENFLNIQDNFLLLLLSSALTLSKNGYISKYIHMGMWGRGGFVYDYIQNTVYVCKHFCVCVCVCVCEVGLIYMSGRLLANFLKS